MELSRLNNCFFHDFIQSYPLSDIIRLTYKLFTTTYHHNSNIVSEFIAKPALRLAYWVRSPISISLENRIWILFGPGNFHPILLKFASAEKKNRCEIAWHGRTVDGKLTLRQRILEPHDSRVFACLRSLNDPKWNTVIQFQLTPGHSKLNLNHDIWFTTMWHLTSVYSEEPMQPPFKLRNSKWCSVISLTVIEYSSD